MFRVEPRRPSRFMGSRGCTALCSQIQALLLMLLPEEGKKHGGQDCMQ
jgi:hypothetical protein